MRLHLRLKILLITVLPLVLLALATLWTVNRSVTRQVSLGIHDDLVRSSAVFENILAARAHTLAVSGAAIAQDPKFFSVLTLPGSWRDPQIRATVRGVARDFNQITQSDLFEVLDARGHLVASVGRDAASETARAPVLQKALSGHAASGILVDRDAHYQVSAAPVVAGGRVVGVLLLGARIGGELAAQLRQLTRSDVTFISGSTRTGSTLDESQDLAALSAALAVPESQRASKTRDGALFQVQGARHRYLTLVRTIPESFPGRRQLYVMQRSLDVEMAFLRRGQAGLLLLGLLAVAAALIAGWVISDRITSPVQRLVRGAQEMERGNYDYPLGERAEDEIGYLAQTFHQMRRKQRAYVASLQEVTRLKSEFIAVASHELRTPITVIKGFQEMMEQEALGPVTPKQAKALEAMGQSIGTLARIAEDATRMAQIEGERLALDIAPHEIETVIQSAVSTATTAAPQRQVRVVTTLESRIGGLLVDGPRLEVALANLISNGIRFTPDGGRVDVRARLEGAELLLEVRDTGVGIPEDRQRTVFDCSFKVGDSLNHHSSSSLEFNSAGLGLGLSIARGIVHAHGGAIRLESRVGEGSTFVIQIPAERGTPLAEAA
jgi:signal transduction histidine kinase